MPQPKKFLRLKAMVIKNYVGKRVPLKYRAQYGKVYSRKEAENIAYAIGNKMGWRV